MPHSAATHVPCIILAVWPQVGNTIGMRNRRLFLAFLWAELAAMIIVAWVAVLRVRHVARRQGPDPTRGLPWALGFIVSDLFVMLGVAALAITQVRPAACTLILYLSSLLCVRHVAIKQGPDPTRGLPWALGFIVSDLFVMLGVAALAITQASASACFVYCLIPAQRTSSWDKTSLDAAAAGLPHLEAVCSTTAD